MDETKKVTFNAFDRDAEIEFSERNLPHWSQADAAMFITFCTSLTDQLSIATKNQPFSQVGWGGCDSLIATISLSD